MHPKLVSEEESKYLLTLPAIRERCQKVYDQVVQGHSKYLQVNFDQLGYCVDWVVEAIQHQYGNVESILPHTRWRHYQEKTGEAEGMQVDRIETLLQTWATAKVGKREQSKRVLDLMTVSVLLDAGAGDIWKYKDIMTGRVFHRSEGLAMAVYNMFLLGHFSSSKELHPCQVDATALKQLTVDSLKKAFQVTEHNPLVGLESRCHILCKLGQVLEANPYFPSNSGMTRPGNMIDSLFPEDQSISSLSLTQFWPVLLSLQPIFPVHAGGPFSSDIFYCELIQAWVPFHKLSQWLTYTYLEVFERILNVSITEKHVLTGLAEYRNGGLLFDTQVLTVKTPLESYPVDHPLIVEWRACTLVFLDLIAQELRKHYHVDESQLGLEKVLEGGTWKAGRDIAKKLRPENGSPPLRLHRDGTVF